MNFFFPLNAPEYYILYQRVFVVVLELIRHKMPRVEYIWRCDYVLTHRSYPNIYHGVASWIFAPFQCCTPNVGLIGNDNPRHLCNYVCCCRSKVVHQEISTQTHTLVLSENIIIRYGCVRTCHGIHGPIHACWYNICKFLFIVSTFILFYLFQVWIQITTQL